MTIIQSLATAFAPWQSLYSDNAIVSTAVTTTHIVSLLVGGGLAIAADRTTLRAIKHKDPDWRYHLAELHAVHRPVIAMIALIFVSGVLLAAADIKTFAAAPMFWVKLGLVALLMINGAALYRTEEKLTADLGERLQRRLGMFAKISLVLWITTAIAGTVLTNV